MRNDGGTLNETLHADWSILTGLFKYVTDIRKCGYLSKPLFTCSSADR